MPHRTSVAWIGGLLLACGACSAKRSSPAATPVGAGEVGSAPGAPASRAVPVARSTTLVIPERFDRAPIVSPDGTQWVAKLPDRISVRSVDTGVEVASLAIDTGGLDVALLDGGRLAVSDRESVRVLDAAGKVEKIVHEDAKGMAEVAVFAGPENRLALVDEHAIEIVSVAAGRVGTSLARAERPAGSFSPRWRWGVWHGDTLAFFDGARFEVWRVVNGKLSRGTMLAACDRAPCVMSGYSQLAVAWDGKRIAIPLLDNRVRVIDPSGATVMETKDTAYAEQLGFAGDQLYCRSFGDFRRIVDGKVVDAALPRRAWHLAEAGERLIVAPDGVLAAKGEAFELSGYFDPGAPIDALAWSASGDQLAIAADDDATIFDAGGARATKGQGRVIGAGEPFVFRGATSELWWLATNVTDSVLARWDSKRTTDSHMDADAAQVRGAGSSTVCALSQDGTRYLHGEHEHDLELRDTTNDKPQQRIHIASKFRPQGALDVRRAMFVDRDRRLIVSGEGVTAVWNLALKVLVWQVEGDLVTASRDGATFVTGSSTELTGWDLASQRELGTIKVRGVSRQPRKDSSTQTLPLVPAAFSPDGTVLAVGTESGAIELVDVATWQVVATIAAHETEVLSLAWRPDGKVLATGSMGGAVKLWSFAAAGSAAASPSLTLLATVAIGHNVLPSGSLLRMADEAPPGRADPDQWTALFPDGTVFGSAAGRVHVARRDAAGTHALAPPEAGALVLAQMSTWTGLFTSPGSGQTSQ